MLRLRDTLESQRSYGLRIILAKALSVLGQHGEAIEQLQVAISMASVENADAAEAESVRNLISLLFAFLSVNISIIYAIDVV
jgi:hypothetical protein